MPTITSHRQDGVTDDLGCPIIDQSFDTILIKTLDYEASFLRLLDKITNGTGIKINESGDVAPSPPTHTFFFLLLHPINSDLSCN